MVDMHTKLLWYYNVALKSTLIGSKTELHQLLQLKFELDLASLMGVFTWRNFYQVGI